jgi:adenylate kinase family enzyme
LKPTHICAEVTLGLLRAAIDKLARNENAKCFLVDGFPREVDQAVAFEKEVRV